MKAKEAFDVIIVGAGPAGLAAGIGSAIFGLRTLILEANQRAGGIAVRARGVQLPCFSRKVSGLRLMERMVRQAQKMDAELHTSEEVVNFSLQDGMKVVETKRGIYFSKALILATGSGMKGLGLKRETWFGGGVAFCAECGAPFFEGKDVIVAGNVGEAIEEALRLKVIAATVLLVNNANNIPINERMREQLESKGIRIIGNHVGEKIEGKPPIKKLVLRNLKNSSVRRLETNIVFVVGGVKPFVSVLRKTGIATHRLGCIVTDEFGRTNIDGVFAAGSCASTVKDIIPSCIGDGITVATCARLYVAYKS